MKQWWILLIFMIGSAPAVACHPSDFASKQDWAAVVECAQQDRAHAAEFKTNVLRLWIKNNRKVSEIQKALGDPSVQLNFWESRNGDPISPLTWAVEQRDITLFLSLLKRGADPDFANTEGVSARTWLQEKIVLDRKKFNSKKANRSERIQKESEWMEWETMGAAMVSFSKNIDRPEDYFPWEYGPPSHLRNR
jgi:hypothetical protein